MANVTNKTKIAWKNAVQVLAPKLWPLPKEVGIKPRKVQQLFSEDPDLVSLVFVRNPFKRLASVYYQKVMMPH